MSAGADCASGKHHMYLSSGWHCLLCGKDKDTIRWEEEMRSRHELAEALRGLTTLLEQLTHPVVVMEGPESSANA